MRKGFLIASLLFSNSCLFGMQRLAPAARRLALSSARPIATNLRQAALSKPTVLNNLSAGNLTTTSIIPAAHNWYKQQRNLLKIDEMLRQYSVNGYRDLYGVNVAKLITDEKSAQMLMPIAIDFLTKGGSYPEEHLIMHMLQVVPDMVIDALVKSKKSIHLDILKHILNNKNISPDKIVPIMVNAFRHGIEGHSYNYNIHYYVLEYLNSLSVPRYATFYEEFCAQIRLILSEKNITLEYLLDNYTEKGHTTKLPADNDILCLICICDEATANKALNKLISFAENDSWRLYKDEEPWSTDRYRLFKRIKTFVPHNNLVEAFAAYGKPIWTKILESLMTDKESIEKLFPICLKMFEYPYMACKDSTPEFVKLSVECLGTKAIATFIETTLDPGLSVNNRNCTNYLLSKLNAKQKEAFTAEVIRQQEDGNFKKNGILTCLVNSNNADLFINIAINKIGSEDFYNIVFLESLIEVSSKAHQELIQVALDKYSTLADTLPKLSYLVTDKASAEDLLPIAINKLGSNEDLDIEFIKSIIDNSNQAHNELIKVALNKYSTSAKPLPKLSYLIIDKSNAEDLLPIAINKLGTNIEQDIKFIKSIIAHSYQAHGELIRTALQKYSSTTAPLPELSYLITHKTNVEDLLPIAINKLSSNIEQEIEFIKMIINRSKKAQHKLIKVALEKYNEDVELPRIFDYLITDKESLNLLLPFIRTKLNSDNSRDIEFIDSIGIGTHYEIRDKLHDIIIEKHENGEAVNIDIIISRICRNGFDQSIKLLQVLEQRKFELKPELLINSHNGPTIDLKKLFALALAKSLTGNDLDTFSKAHIIASALHMEEKMKGVEAMLPYKKIINKIINQEIKLKESGKASFVHSQMRCYAFQIDVTKDILDELARRGLVDPLPENFVFIQNPRQIFANDQQMNNGILLEDKDKQQHMMIGRTEQWRLPERFSAHPFIFGGTSAEGSCPWHYFLGNYNVNSGGMLNLKRDICGVFNISDNCLENLDNLKSEYTRLFNRGRILQLGIPFELVDDLIYLAQPGAGKGMYSKPDGNQIKEVSEFLKYVEDNQNNPENLVGIDRQEVALMLTQAIGLNPYAIEVHRHDPAPLDAEKYAGHLAKRAELVKSIVDEIEATWKKDSTITYPRHFVGSPIFDQQ